jgi:RHS repeat-associated protein
MTRDQRRRRLQLKIQLETLETRRLLNAGLGPWERLRELSRLDTRGDHRFYALYKELSAKFDRWAAHHPILATRSGIAAGPLRSSSTEPVASAPSRQAAPTTTAAAAGGSPEPAPSSPVIPNNSAEDGFQFDQNCGCGTTVKSATGTPMNSDASLLTGEFLQDHQLVTYQSLGLSRGIDLQYTSLEANPQPIVGGVWNFGQENFVAYLTISLTVNAVPQGNQITINPAPPHGTYRIELPTNLSGLSTGLYTEALTITFSYLGGGSTSETFLNPLMVVNDAASPYGAGWSIGGLQSLTAGTFSGMPMAGISVGSAPPEVFTSTDGVHYVGDLIDSAGDAFDTSKLVWNSSTSTWTRTYTDGTVLTFNSSGQEVSSADRNGNTTQYAYVPTGAAAAGALQTITDPVGLVTTLSYDGIGHLSTVTDPVQPTVPGLVDVGFEQPYAGPAGTFGSFVYDPTGTAWTYAGGAGVAANGSGFTSGNPNAPEGTQVGFLQGTGSFSQSVAGWAAGSYQISFDTAQRGNDGSDQNFEVLVDGNVVGSFTPSGTSYGLYTTPSFFVSSGTHTITFQGLDSAGGDNTALVDAVAVAHASVPAIGDAGFEQPAGTNGSFVYDPTGTAWSFAGLAGVSANGSGFTAGNPAAPEGTQVGILQETGSFSQSVAGWASGSYVIAFDAAQRGNNGGSNQDFEVLVDSIVVGTFTPSGTSYQGYSTGVFTVAAGSHTITFQGLDSIGGDNTALIDAVAIAPAAGRVTNFTIDSRDNLTQIVDPDGATTTYGYDYYSHHMMSETNPDGQTATVGYDPNGRMSVENLFDGTSTVQLAGAQENGLMSWGQTYTSFPQGNLQGNVTDPNHNTTAVTFDGLGGVLTELDGASDLTTITRNSNGWPVAVTDPMNRTTSYGYDQYGDVTKIIRPDTTYETITYNDNFGIPTEITDYKGQTTTYTLDSHGNILKRTDPDGLYESYTYNSAGQVLTDTDRNGVTFTIGPAGSADVVAASGQTIALAQGNDSTLALLATAVSGSQPNLTFTVTYTDGSTQTFTQGISDWFSPQGYTGESQAVTMAYRDLANGSTDNRTFYLYGYKFPLNPAKTVSSLTLPSNSNVELVGATLLSAQSQTPVDLSSWFNRTGIYVDGSTFAGNGGLDGGGAALSGTLLGTSQKWGGNTTTYAYDIYGRLTTTTYPGTGAPTDKLTYDGAGDIRTETDPVGNTVTYSYDSADRLLATQNPIQAAVGGAVAYGYDPAGNLTSVTDANGHTTSYVYDARNRLIAVVDPVNQGTGRATSYVYDAQGNLTQVIDPLGHSTTYLYDQANRLTGVIDADSNQTTYTLDGDGEVTAVHDPNGHTTSYSYNNLGLLQSETLPGTAPTVYTYDPNNNLTQVVDPLNDTVTYGYDSLDRQTGMTQVLSGQSGSSNLRTTYVYDPNGNLAAVIDPNGHTTSYTYDARNNQLTETDPSGGGTTTYAYDGSDRLISITDPNSNITTYQYDSADRVTTVTDPLGVTTYTYDLMDNVTGKTDNNGRIYQFGYDGDNRETTEKWIPIGGGTAFNTITYTYDPAGRLTQVQDANSNYDYTYDSANRLLTADDNGTIGLPQVTLTYGYDPAGNRTSMDDSLGGLTSYTYDVRNELVTLTLSGTGVTPERADFGYDAAGRMTTLTRYADLAGGTVAQTSAYAYDSLGRVTGIADKTSGGATDVSYGYQYDSAGRVTQETRTWSTGSDTLTYGYTDNNQLISVTHSNSSLANESFNYDANGNRNTGGSMPESDNRLATDGTYNYVYDGVGNLISKTQISSGDETVYTYDDHNRLTEVDSVVGGVTTVLATYAYDALDRRIGMTEGATTTWTLYDGTSTDPLLDFNGSGSQTARYLNGPQGDIVDTVLARQTAGAVAWYLPDRLGTVRDLIDNSGNILDHVDYSAFGSVMAESSVSSGDRFMGFEGMERDTASGLNLAVYRVEDPGTGRWDSQDPLGFAAGDPNVYRFVGNGPTDFNDPLGLDALDNAANFFAGWGDTLTFNLTNVARNQLGINGGINSSSGYYVGGQVVGSVHQIGLGGGAIKGGIGVLNSGRTIGGGARIGAGVIAVSRAGVTTGTLEGAVVATGGAMLAGAGAGQLLCESQGQGSEGTPEGGGGEKPEVLQTRGHTITDRVRKALGLTKDEAKMAMEKLKRSQGQGPSHHQHKILDNGDVLDANTGEWLGNLFEK